MIVALRSVQSLFAKYFRSEKKSIFGEYWFSFSKSWKTISVRKTEVKTKSGVPVPFTW